MDGGLKKGEANKQLEDKDALLASLAARVAEFERQTHP